MTLATKNNDAASKNELVSTCDDSLFKLPLPPVVRRKKILDEDTYTQDLENIIERDFFPDLGQMKAQLEYREALESNDVTKLRELRTKYGTKLDTGGATDDQSQLAKSPATFDTPVVNDGNATPSSDGANGRGSGSKSSEPRAETKNRKLSERTLDSYLASCTSEDNASFAIIMEEAEKRHRQKFSWLYDKEIEHRKFQDDCLALPSVEEQATDRHRVGNLDTWTYTNKNYVMYVPEGAELTAAEKQDLAVKQREVVYFNTRFYRMPFNEQANREAISAAAQLQARTKEGKIGVDGKEVIPADEPQVNGYGFVVTPSPAPGVNESPLMTWGEIEGTPFRLDGSDTPIPQAKGPSFHIAAVPARDRLALELAEKVGKQHREKKKLALKAVKATLATPSPRTSHVERLASMSPAAQRLASSRLGIHLGTDKSLRLSYTPTRTPSKNTPYGGSTPISTPLKTPSQSPRGSKRSSNDPSASSITDDLLMLPKTTRARDSFV